MEKLGMHLNEGVLVHAQSDVQELADDIESHFQNSNLFQQEEVDSDMPLGVRSAREKYVLDQGLPVYRLRFRRV